MSLYLLQISGVQRMSFLLHIVLSSVACLAVLYFLCVLSFSTTFSETFPVLKTIQRDIIISVRKCSCKIPVVLVGIELKLIYLGGFWKKFIMSNFMKISQVGDKFFLASRQTDMTKPIVDFRNFRKVSKNEKLSLCL